MAPTLGRVDGLEMEEVFVADTRAGSSQASQMSSANRSNGDTHRDGDTASQSERGSVHESNLQASAEQRHAVTTPHDTITAAQAQQEQLQPAAAPELLGQPPQPAAPHPVLLSELLRVQDEQEAEISRIYNEFRTTANEIRTTAMLQAQMAEQQANEIRTTAMLQAQMAEQHQASRAESRAHFQAVLRQFNSVQEAQRKSDEMAQKAHDDVKKMKEEFKVKVEGTVRGIVREETVRGIEGIIRETLPKAIKKEVKREAKKEKVKKEKAEGKPRKNKSLYNFHVMEERKRLKELGSDECLFKVAAQNWKGMSDIERWRRYGEMFQQDKERYEREMEGWWKEHKVSVDERKPAAKPTPDERAVSQESVTDAPIVSQPPSEEPVAAAAACPPARPGPGAPDEGDQLNEYEQYDHNETARNEEHLRNLGLLPSTDGAGAEGNGGFLSRSVNTAAIDRRNAQETTASVAVDAGDPAVGNDNVQRSTSPEVAPFLGGERNSQEEPIHTTEARRPSSMSEAASLPEIDVNHRRDNDNTEDTVCSAAARRLQEPDASLASNGWDGNTEEFTARRPSGVAVQGSTPSVATNKKRMNKKRKNNSPYWYRNFPVFELEGYTDGTPLQPGHVWVEYASGVAVQVKEAELVKKLPPARNSRRRISHNLFSPRSTTSREANSQDELDSSEARPSSSAPEATSPPETIYVSYRRNHATCGDYEDLVDRREPPERDCRHRSNESSVPFPVGYRFYHYVSGGSYHQGYRCVAEVKEVIGDMRRCYYYDLNDGCKRGEGSPFVKTIEKRKIYKN